jgi:hypothetical protein
MLVTSIAIWNWDKIIVAIALGVWGINVVLSIQSESHRPLQSECHANIVWYQVPRE